MYQQNNPSFATPTLPTLPDTLLTYSEGFLRKTSQFDLYYQVIDTDPCEIDLRDYTHLSMPIDEVSHQDHLDLLHAINGKQLSRLEIEGERRYEESGSNYREVTETAKDDLQHMLDAWCHVESCAWPEDDTTAGLVHHLSLEWGARAIVSLFTELEVRREGLAKYQSAYRGRKLWWQRIKVY